MECHVTQAKKMIRNKAIGLINTSVNDAAIDLNNMVERHPAAASLVATEMLELIAEQSTQKASLVDLAHRIIRKADKRLGI